MELNPDFQEFLQSFVSHDVRFLIVGGYALAAHGHPRYTKDLDVWVWTDPSNAERVVAALEEFGFGGLGLTSADFEEPTWWCTSDLRPPDAVRPVPVAHVEPVQVRLPSVVGDEPAARRQVGGVRTVA
jgi:hypothetical protein